MIFDKKNPMEDFFTEKKDVERPITTVFNKDTYVEHDGNTVLFGSANLKGVSVKTLEAILEMINNDINQ